MTTVTRERWLVLDDCAFDRRRVAMAFEGQKDSLEIVLASTVSEAQDYLAKHEVQVCLFDFFLRGTTTAKLIAETRNRFVNMPIIVVSSYAGREERIYKAGADAVIPKVADFASFASIVQNAVLHSKSLREAKVLTAPARILRLSASLLREIRGVLAAERGNVLVVSSPGMGRTAVARHLAERMPLPSSERRRIFTYVCQPDAPPEVIDSALFGADSAENSAGQPGLLLAAKGGILIIENAHLLPEKIQEKLAAFGARRKTKSNHGTLIDADTLRIVYTAVAESATLMPGFEKHAITVRIDIPPFTEMTKDLRPVVGFLFDIAINGRTLSLERGVIGDIMNQANQSAENVTMRGLVALIEAAISRAIDDGRSVVLRSDLGSCEEMFDGNQSPIHSEKRQFLLPDDDKLGIDAWLDLYQIVRNGHIEDAEALVRKMMVEYGMISRRFPAARISARPECPPAMRNFGIHPIPS